MRLRILIVAALVALAVPSATVARPGPHHRGHAHGGNIVGTWSVHVTPAGEPSFEALVTFTKGGGAIETESNQPGTGQGAWHRIGRHRFAFAFETFIFSPTGQPAGHIVVRSILTLNHGTLAGTFKFDVFDPAGHKVQSGSGTATATRFVIPKF